jgi:hypothetical protein
MDDEPANETTPPKKSKGKKKFKVVRLPAPEVEVFRIDVEAIYRVWAREAFEEKEE